MPNLQKNLLDQFDSSIQELLKEIDLSQKSEEQINKLKSYLQESLGDRIILFVLENLSSKGLEQYEKLITQDSPDTSEINNLLHSDIKDFKNRLRVDLIKFSQAYLNNI